MHSKPARYTVVLASAYGTATILRNGAVLVHAQAATAAEALTLVLKEVHK